MQNRNSIDVVERHCGTADLIVLYDGGCPFCSRFVELCELRENFGSVLLANVRQYDRLYEELLAFGFNLDEGMISIHGQQLYFGADSIALLSRKSARVSPLVNVVHKLLSIKLLSKLTYPFLVYGRNYVLSMRGVGRIGAADSESILGTIGQVTTLVVINAILLKVFYAFFSPGILSLPESAYVQHQSVVAALILQPTTGLCAFALAALPFLLARSTNWSSLDVAPAIRWIPLASAMMIVWFLVTNGSNFWTGQSRELDHFVILTLLMLLWRHPAFVGIFLLLSLTLFNELNYPLWQFWISEKGAILDQLILLYAFVLTRPGFSRSYAFSYVVLAVLVHLQNYVWAGLQKIVIGEHIWDWFLYNRTFDLSVRMFQEGWRPLDSGTYFNLISYLQILTVPLNVSVLGFQLLCALVFFKRQLFLWIFLFAAIFHVAIFLLTGILFWEWIVLSLVFEILVLYWMRDGLERRMFGWKWGVIGAVLLVMAPLWHKPHKLGWFDVPYANIVLFGLEDAQGNKFRVTGNDFEPYDRLFNYHEDFLFMFEAPVLARSGLDEIKALRGMTSLTDLEAFQSSQGAVFYDPAKTAVFEKFVTQFVCFEDSGTPWTQFIPAAPRHLQRIAGTWDIQEGKAGFRGIFRARFEQYWWPNGQIRHFGSTETHEFQINCGD